MTTEALLLAALFFVAAVLYSSVGHAGASAYLAAMALVGVSASTMRPTALVLNLCVATIVIVRFARAGHLPWRDLVPLAAGSVPMAFLGGSIDLPSAVYRPLVAVVLLAGAWRLATATIGTDDEKRSGVPVIPGVLAGAAIGLLAGLTGTGGGIFLTPLMLFMHWARAKQAAAVSALFILVNSVAGLAGNLTSTKYFPTFTLALVAAAAVGGATGSWFGSRRFDPILIKRLLAVVLLIAGTKLLLT